MENSGDDEWRESYEIAAGFYRSAGSFVVFCDDYEHAVHPEDALFYCESAAIGGYGYDNDGYSYYAERITAHRYATDWWPHRSGKSNNCARAEFWFDTIRLREKKDDKEYSELMKRLADEDTEEYRSGDWVDRAHKIQEEHDREWKQIMDELRGEIEECWSGVSRSWHYSHRLDDDQ